jgi:UDP-glucose:(heptosyl)LPS alpha-1,3-glucosyltransferase
VKIAIIRQKYVNYGGAENFSAECALQLAKAGHEVHIFANRWTSPELPNIYFHKVPAVRIGSLLRYLSFAWMSARLVRRGKFDVVQSHERTWHQDIYRAGDGCHKEWLEQRRKYVSPLKRWWLALSPFHRAILKIEQSIFTKGRYKKIIAISEMVKENIRKHYHVPAEDIVVIYNGVRLEKFNPANKALHYRAIRSRFKVPDKALMMLYVGSGFERKGLEFLIRALDRLECDDWRLMVIGKGDWARYRGFASQKSQEKIIYLEPVSDIEAYYAAADVFVLPSLYEPFGNANLEALATGLPVITSRHSGAADIIRHKHNGLIVENPGDPGEIASQINYLFDPAVREQMGKQARSLAEQFTLEKNTSAMVRVYGEVAKMSKMNG